MLQYYGTCGNMYMHLQSIMGQYVKHLYNRLKNVNIYIISTQ